MSFSRFCSSRNLRTLPNRITHRSGGTGGGGGHQWIVLRSGILSWGRRSFISGGFSCMWVCGPRWTHGGQLPTTQKRKTMDRRPRDRADIKNGMPTCTTHRGRSTGVHTATRGSAGNHPKAQKSLVTAAAKEVEPQFGTTPGPERAACVQMFSLDNDVAIGHPGCSPRAHLANEIVPTPHQRGVLVPLFPLVGPT